MDLIHGFEASGTFYDDANFPYGFSKSGFFSLPESELLSQLGRRLAALEQDVVLPANQVEQHFVDMCVNKREADTRVELLWLKYKKHARRKAAITLGTVVSVDDETVSQTIEEG